MADRGMTIVVKYSCARCGVRDAELTVPAREDEDVIVWMEEVIVLIAQAHRKAHPDCRERQLQNLMIPMPPGVDRVGGAIRH